MAAQMQNIQRFPFGPRSVMSSLAQAFHLVLGPDLAEPWRFTLTVGAT